MMQTRFSSNIQARERSIGSEEKIATKTFVHAFLHHAESAGESGDRVHVSRTNSAPLLDGIAASTARRRPPLPRRRSEQIIAASQKIVSPLQARKTESSTTSAAVTAPMFASMLRDDQAIPSPAFEMMYELAAGGHDVFDIAERIKLPDGRVLPVVRIDRELRTAEAREYLDLLRTLDAHIDKLDSQY